MHIVAAAAWCVAEGISNAAEGIAWGALLAVALLRLPATRRCYPLLLRDVSFMLFAGLLLLRAASAGWAIGSAAAPTFPRSILTVLALWPVAGRPWVLLVALWAGCVVQVVVALALSWTGSGMAVYSQMKSLSAFGQLQWNSHCALVISLSLLRALPAPAAPLPALAAALASACAWFSASRVLLVSCAGGALVALFRPPPRMRTSLVVAVLCLCALAGAVAVAMSPAGARSSREVQRLLGTDPGNEAALGIAAGRPIIWQAAVETGLRHPWLGSGQGSVGPLLDGWLAEQGSREGVDASWARRCAKVASLHIRDAHNALLQIWLECGLPGVALFIGAIGTIAVRLWRDSRHAPASGAACAVFAAVLLGTFVSVIFAKAPMALVSICLVIAAVPAIPPRRA